ncbi:toll/interleukin-1 receptor domain-containing protein [Algiphilus sp.]|uniref:toll/interleukin-1 receptor domain-containing protein n=1 Tax=Algiphilus sp. TaxID=1872431 RepID=UPI003BACCBB5
MTPSQRVKAIAEIAKRLSPESWALIDLTLTQFGLPSSDTWSGNSESYVLHMLSAASDSQLRDLSHHVGFEFESPASLIDPPFWKPGHFRVFLSHLAAHRAFAAELKNSLETYGISSFVAHNDIEPTLEWQNEIETALSTCEALIALLHENFNQSNWTDQEIGFVMGRGLPAFSVRLGKDPYGFIGRFQAFNGHGKSTDQLAKEIFDALRTRKETQERMSEIVVSRFENSYSFQNAKENVKLVEELQSWHPGYSERLSDAVESNSQISSSWGVPERVKKIIEKWEGGGA